MSALPKQSHYESLPKKISIVWHIEDVLSVKSTLTAQEASLVLKHLKEHHDASIGINWDTIEIVADNLFG